MKPIWSGTISFGLVNIPVKLYPATKERRLNFDYLRKKDLCPVGNVRVCKETGEEVPYSDIVRGYEIKKGDYVVLEDEDFKRRFKKTNAIEITDFTDKKDISPKYFEKPYLITPEKGAEKIYVLLREALKESEKMAISHFVLKTQEHLGGIYVEENILYLSQMRFESEFRSTHRLNIPKNLTVSENELSMALKLVNELSSDFVPEKYKDIYTEELKETIEEKAKGKKVTPTRRAKKPKATPMSKLIGQLKESIDQFQRTGYPNR